METSRVSVRLPNELLAKADVAAEVTHKTRTEIVEEAVQKYLEEVEDDESFKEAVIEMNLEDRIGFGTLKEFVGSADARAVRTSKTILDQSDELADDLADQ